MTNDFVKEYIKDKMLPAEEGQKKDVLNYILELLEATSDYKEDYVSREYLLSKKFEMPISEHTSAMVVYAHDIEVAPRVRPCISCKHYEDRCKWLPDETPGIKKTSMNLVSWQYFKDLNEINEAILHPSDDWEGLNSADDIINITYDTMQGRYVVYWRAKGYVNSI